MRCLTLGNLSSVLAHRTDTPPACLPPCPRSKLDPPTNYFRIRLVCGLLGVCGQYFTRGAARRKLDRFLPYLQRYLLAKPPLPLDVEFDVQVGSGQPTACRPHAGCVGLCCGQNGCRCDVGLQEGRGSETRDMV